MNLGQPFPPNVLSLFTVAVSIVYGSCTTSDLVTQLKSDEGGAPPSVILLGKGKKVVMNYALRRTRLQVQLKFDVVKITTMVRVDGKNDVPTKDPVKYQLWPNTGENAVVCTVDYVNDPKLTFRVMADERKKTFLGADETFNYDESGRLIGISTTYEGKAAETIKSVISTAANLAKLGVSMGLFASEGPSAATYQKREVQDQKLIVKTTIYPESLEATGTGRFDYSYSFEPDIQRALLLYLPAAGITEVGKQFDLSLHISTRSPIASSRSLHAKIERAGNGGQLKGLPVRAEAGPAIVSFVATLAGGQTAAKLAEQEIAMPELADVVFLPFPSNPWRSSLSTSVDLYPSGAIKKYGRKSSSAAADTAAAASSITGQLNTDIPAITKQIADAKKADASLRLKILGEKATIRQKEDDLQQKIAALATITDPEHRRIMRNEIEAEKSQIQIEQEKLNYLQEGVDL
jgi:hypothetical protein